MTEEEIIKENEEISKLIPDEDFQKILRISDTTFDVNQNLKEYININKVIK